MNNQRFKWHLMFTFQTLRAITVEEIGMEEASQDSNTNNNQDPLVSIKWLYSKLPTLNTK